MKRKNAQALRSFWPLGLILLLSAADGLMIEALAAGAGVDMRAKLRRLAGALVGAA